MLIVTYNIYIYIFFNFLMLLFMNHCNDCPLWALYWTIKFLNSYINHVLFCKQSIFFLNCKRVQKIEEEEDTFIYSLQIFGYDSLWYNCSIVIIFYFPCISLFYSFVCSSHLYILSYIHVPYGAFFINKEFEFEFVIPS